MIGLSLGKPIGRPLGTVRPIVPWVITAQTDPEWTSAAGYYHPDYGWGAVGSLQASPNPWRGSDLLFIYSYYADGKTYFSAAITGVSMLAFFKADPVLVINDKVIPIITGDYGGEVYNLGSGYYGVTLVALAVGDHRFQNGQTYEITVRSRKPKTVFQPYVVPPGTNTPVTVTAGVDGVFSGYYAPELWGGLGAATNNGESGNLRLLCCYVYLTEGVGLGLFVYIVGAPAAVLIDSRTSLFINDVEFKFSDGQLEMSNERTGIFWPNVPLSPFEEGETFEVRIGPST